MNYLIICSCFSSSKNEISFLMSWMKTSETLTKMMKRKRMKKMMRRKEIGFSYSSFWIVVFSSLRELKKAYCYFFEN